MGQRANPSGNRLSARDAAVVKAMPARGDRQHDIAAWFGVNSGRIAEIATGKKHGSVPAATEAILPPPGPYPSGRDPNVAMQALRKARAAIEEAEAAIRRRAREQRAG